jgi:hypothetical protein
MYYIYVGLYVQVYLKRDKQQVGPTYCKAGLVILFPGRNISSQAGITGLGPA